MAFQKFPPINLQLTADGKGIKVPGELGFKVLDFVVDSCSTITVIVLENVPTHLWDKIDTEIRFLSTRDIMEFPIKWLASSRMFLLHLAITPTLSSIMCPLPL